MQEDTGQFLEMMLAVIKVINELKGRGHVNGNINPETVLTPRRGKAGDAVSFIDFEPIGFPYNGLGDTAQPIDPHVNFYFKAIHMLQNMLFVESSATPAPEHDLESLIWVAIYSDFGGEMGAEALLQNRWYMSTGGFSNLSLVYARLEDRLGELVTGMLMLVGRQNGTPWPSDHVLRKYIGECADDPDPLSKGHLERFVRAWKAANWDAMQHDA